jgi:hypothetical protein
MQNGNNLVKGPIWSGAKHKRERGRQVLVEDVAKEMKIIKLKLALNIEEAEAEQLLEKIDSGQELSFSNDQMYQLMVYGLTFHCKDTKENRLRRQQVEEEIEFNRKAQAELLKKAEAWVATLTDEQREMAIAYGQAHGPTVIA